MLIQAQTTNRELSLINKDIAKKRVKKEGRFILFITIKKSTWTFSSESKRKQFIKNYKEQLIREDGVNKFSLYEFITSELKT